MTFIAALFIRRQRLTQRNSWLRWAEKWGVSIASLAGGLLALFVFRRGLPHVGWIVGYLILLWLLFTLLTRLRQGLEARGRTLVITAADYTIQTLTHGLLLFILPGYYASATLTSVNVWFFLLLVAMALLTTIDVWYRVVVLPYAWARHAMFATSFFAALNVALPLVGVSPLLALMGSGVLSTVSLAPVFRHEGVKSWSGAWMRTGLLSALALALLWWVRVAIPPAPLHLAHVTVARIVERLEPVDPVRGEISAEVLREWGGLAAYTAVYAPAGLKQPIVHVWKTKGRSVTTIPLSPIRGGRSGGFRTYSRKSDFAGNVVGSWEVDAMTSSGQLIGRLRFTITP